jgi:hypothetical protein
MASSGWWIAFFKDLTHIDESGRPSIAAVQRLTYRSFDRSFRAGLPHWRAWLAFEDAPDHDGHAGMASTVR